MQTPRSEAAVRSPRAAIAQVYPNCYAVSCTATQVAVALGGLRPECPGSGQLDLSSLDTEVRYLAGSALLCPSREALCFSAADASSQQQPHLGTAACGAQGCSSTTGSCFQGECYCTVGWTGTQLLPGVLPCKVIPIGIIPWCRGPVFACLGTLCCVRIAFTWPHQQRLTMTNPLTRSHAPSTDPRPDLQWPEPWW